MLHIAILLFCKNLCTMHITYACAQELRHGKFRTWRQSNSNSILPITMFTPFCWRSITSPDQTSQRLLASSSCWSLDSNAPVSKMYEGSLYKLEVREVSQGRTMIRILVGIYNYMNSLKATPSGKQTGRTEKYTRPRLGFEPATFVLLVGWPHRLSYEVKLGEVAERWYFYGI